MKNLMKETLPAAVALATVSMQPGFAASDKVMAPQQHTQMTAPASSNANAMNGQFIAAEASDDWRASKLIGMNVTGPDNKTIGDINDILVASTGNVRFAIIGVGGFLGVGEKNVAVPFSNLKVTRNATNNVIESVSVALTRDELKAAPEFKWRTALSTMPEKGKSAERPMMAPDRAKKE